VSDEFRAKGKEQRAKGKGQRENQKSNFCANLKLETLNFEL
jgi:hypothetical protein